MTRRLLCAALAFPSNPLVHLLPLSSPDVFTDPTLVHWNSFRPSCVVSQWGRFWCKFFVLNELPQFPPPSALGVPRGHWGWAQCSCFLPFSWQDKPPSVFRAFPCCAGSPLPSGGIHSFPMCAKITWFGSSIPLPLLLHLSGCEKD